MDYISGWCRSDRRLEGCTVIVTGGNAGIGKETVLDLYKRGARVITACRNTTKGEETKIEFEQLNIKNAGHLVVERLDLTSLKSVRQFANRIVDNELHVNILINNAGVMVCPEGRTEDGFETHMGTNHFGHALLTLLLLPRLIKSSPSRIICLSSMLHERHNVDFDDMNFEKKTYDPLEAYARSKAANVLFARALALKLKERNIQGVTAYSLHPGVIATGISQHMSSAWFPGATWLFNYVLGWFLKTPRCGAQTTIYCAVDEHCANESGLYYSECKVKESSEQCRDDSEALKLWDVTIKMLELDNLDPFGEHDTGEEFLGITS